MHIVQSVLSHLKNINPIVKTYALSLLLSNGRKNCAAMARSTKLSPKPLYAFLSKEKTFVKEIKEKLICLAKDIGDQGGLRALSLDPSAIIKHYAKEMEKLCYDRSGCTKHTEHCLVPVYVVISNKNTTIPLSLDFWVQEKITGKRKYQSKAKITQKLIAYVIDSDVTFDFIALDGAYSIPEMFEFFHKNSHLQFIMRIARNRKIKLADGTRVQLQNCKTLKLTRNEREKTIVAELYGKSYFFTAEKRQKSGGGWETVFLVSNMDIPAKEQVAAYKLRWPMEKMIRTTKQKFGAGQCQVIKSSKQHAHIMAGFLNYAILSSIKNNKKKQSVDNLVNFIREFHLEDLINVIQNLQQSSRPLKHLPIAKPLQNNFQNLSQYYDGASCLMH